MDGSQATTSLAGKHPCDVVQALGAQHSEEAAIAALPTPARPLWRAIVVRARTGLAWVRPFGLFLRIIATKGETRLGHGQAFLLATEGGTFERSLKSFRAKPRGRALAEQCPDSLAALRDISTLENCPPGSLGRSYADFKRAHGLDEVYYAHTPVAMAPRSDRSKAHRWYRARFENGHDLRHLLIGYPPDRMGEICLLGFRAGQTGHFGAACLTVLGLLHPKVSRRAVLEAYRRGQRSRLVDLLVWEDRLAEPLALVRASLNLTPTKHFPTPCEPEAYLKADINDLNGGGFGSPGSSVDLADTFGPMSAMHAALNRAGVGMPCGIVAKFKDRTASEMEAAIGAAIARFPVLQTRLAWRASRPVLEPVEGWLGDRLRVSSISLDFKAEEDGPLWHYALTADGADVWLTAVWAHAAADGRSMLHFLATVSAALRVEPWPRRVAQPSRRDAPISVARWLPRFLVERHLPYVRLTQRDLGSHGVSWMVVPRAAAEDSLAKARAEIGGFAAWLAAAASMAFCEQQADRPHGRVSLNLLVSREDLAAFAGFGFAAGSLLMPISLPRDVDQRRTARRIFARQRDMMAGAWDQHLEHFIGREPARHQLFAALSAKGAVAPTVSVSWKGVYDGLGGPDGVTDVACFATSSVAHVSAHMDANGLSISVASRQSPTAREALLRRIGDLVQAAPIDHGLRVETLSLIQ